jgi:hypothetical protein
MASMAVNINQAPIDQQSDVASTVGATLLDDLGTGGLVLAAGLASRIATPNGRMPYDPADPSFGSLIKVQNAQGSITASTTTASGGNMIGGSSLLLIFILWLIFRKKG